jgi:hypothetical protein
MNYTRIDFSDLDLFVRFFPDGEPEGIYAYHGKVRKTLSDGSETTRDSYTEVTHLFTDAAAERIYNAAHELRNEE